MSCSCAGPRFGCGLAQCGSCSVLADGVEIRSCVTPVAAVTDKSITTLEGLAAWYAQTKGLARIRRRCIRCSRLSSTSRRSHCGYCYNGMTVKGAELLANNPQADRSGHPPDHEWPSVPLRNLSAGA